MIPTDRDFFSPQVLEKTLTIVRRHSRIETSRRAVPAARSTRDRLADGWLLVAKDQHDEGVLVVAAESQGKSLIGVIRTIHAMLDPSGPTSSHRASSEAKWFTPLSAGARVGVD